MSYAPARVRFRAPLIATLLVPLLALASLLVPASAASAAPGDIAGATLSWGVKASFRSYLAGPIAHGRIISTGVDTATPYGWSDGSGSRASGAVAYPGTLQFQGHQGMLTGDPSAYALDVTLTDVRVKVTSATAGELQADVVSRDMATGELVSYPDTVIASLNLAGGTDASTASTVAYTGVPASLTAAGVPAFAGFYAVGSALDPVSFSWPVEQAPARTATASVTSATQAGGLGVSVSGSGFAGVTAAYVSIIEKGSEYSYVGAPAQVAPVDGAFTQALTAPTASLDPAKQYEVIAWQTRTNPSASTIYARADITVTAAQWKTLFPPVPALANTVTAASTADGLVVSVAASGFDGSAAAYVSVIEKGSTYTYLGAPAQVSVVDGAFTQALTAPTAALDPAKQYEVIAWKTRTNPSAETIYARADITVTAEQWNAIFPPPAPVVEVDVSGVSKADGVALRVSGSGFGDATAAYAAVIEKGAEAGVGQGSGTIGAPVQVTIADGAFTVTLGAPAAQLDAARQYEVIVWKTRSNPSASTIYARSDITLTPAQWDVLFPPVVVVPETPAPGAGALTWGVKASFRSYVTGPIAHGSITTSGVATTSSGYVFPQSGASSVVGGVGSVAYSGSVRFTGHGGLLDLRLSDPQVRIDSATSGTLFLRVNGGTRVAFASLALASGSTTTATDGSVRYAGVPATITAAGAAAFSLEGSSFYPAGTALDPVSFTVGSAGVSLGGTIVTASAARPAAAANIPEATPPATDGITVDGSPVEGGTITAEADGFQPGEEGILVVIYSTPTTLADDVTADANGRVTWTGTLPRGLTGEHTLTFQGSVDRGAVLDIAAAAELPCTVSDADLVWGFKETFRAYIDGSIANGEWTTDGGVSYETPVFTWADGTGAADLEAGALDVQYSGSVRFTGHGGALDTTIANPRVVVDGDRAVLLLDVTGTTQAGDAVEATAVEFAELDLAGVDAARDGDTVTWADVPATLTAAGAAAFGTYPEGEALDPLTIVATVDADCVGAVSPTTEPTTDELEPEQASDGGWPLWATILIVMLVLLVVAGVVIALVRRRRAA